LKQKSEIFLRKSEGAKSLAPRKSIIEIIYYLTAKKEIILLRQTEELMCSAKIE